MVDYFLQAYSVQPRKARKAHRCCECRGFILPGEVYQYHHGIGEDGPCQFKMCNECHDLMLQLTSTDPDEAIPFTGLGEAICESQDRKDFEVYLNICFRRQSVKRWQINRINEENE